MKHFLLLLFGLTIVFSLGITGLPHTALGTWYVSGQFNSWGTTDPMYDDGTHGDIIAGDGIYAIFFSIALQGRHEFKIRNDDWSFSYPTSGNNWLYAALNDDWMHISLDTNSYGDGWLPQTNRIYGGGGHGAENWTAVGDWQGWDNTDPASVMTWMPTPDFPLQYHKLTTVIATPGTYQYKAVLTGTWDAIGAEGHSTDAIPVVFQTTQPSQEVTFYVNSNLGLARVSVSSVPGPVPEPASIILVASGLFGLTGLRRKFRR